MAPSGEAVETCSCGRNYPAGGVALCNRNRHGVQEAPYGDPFRRVNNLELTTEAYCSECGMSLAASLKQEGDRLVLRILPHMCPVPAPDEEVSA